MVAATVGPLLRDWRSRRRRSQLDVALEVGVSQRHLSFVETGRSRPSPEMVLSIAECLDVPLRERNTLLMAAGHAPRYSQRSLDDAALGRIRESLQRMLDAHAPYPGVVIDRAWNVVLANDAVMPLLTGLPEHVLGPPVNVYRVCLHPDGLAARTTNFGAWSAYLLGQLRRSLLVTGDPTLQGLWDEVSTYPNVAAAHAGHEATSPDEPELLVPFDVTLGDRHASLFTTLTTFGTPQDVTLDELAVELFFPADDATERMLRGG
jgi:transcriptional regulator with XRE-family HTH domain